MPSASPRTASRHHNHHAIKQVDPDLLVTDVPDPYTLLTPGEIIDSGDITLNSEGTWVPVDTTVVGLEAPSSGKVYARIEPPEGYALLDEDDILSPADKYWTDYEDCCSWATVPDKWVNHSLSHVRYNWVSGECGGKRLYVASLLDKARPDNVGIPSRYRQLYPQEKLRKGDLVLPYGHTEWAPVADIDFGLTVEAPSESNKWLRFCRPVGANHQSWYVDREKGAEGNLGGYADPFISKNAAMEAIEQAAAKAGTVPHGIIYDLQGIPLMIYDLPAPSTAACASPTSPESGLEPAPDDERTSPTSPERGIMESAVPLCMAKDAVGGVADIAKMIGLEASSVIARATETMPPKHKWLPSTCDSNPADLWFGPVNEDYDILMWQPCPPDYQGLSSSAGDYLFCRKVVASYNRDELRSKLLGFLPALEEAVRTIKEICEEPPSGTGT